MSVLQLDNRRAHYKEFTKWVYHLCPGAVYVFKINDRRTRGPLILSEVHENTKLAQYDKVPRKEEKTNKQTDDIKHTKNVINQRTVQSANRKIFLLLKGDRGQTVPNAFFRFCVDKQTDRHTDRCH